ncbi:MAG: MFS transporter [Pseudomonadales bacterium]|nr:MFS transporter [Pseudomonadales bacterium]MCP5182757.1 MFS transporter [Pseudomonadales bacterium]
MDMTLRFTALELGSLTGVVLLAFAASIGMAFNIDAIALSFGASNAEAGLVASAELAAVSVGILGFARWGAHFPARTVYFVALVVIFLLNTVCLFTTDLVTLLLMRIPTGLAMGSVSATAMATAARSATPEATFGVINSALGGMGLVLAWVLPRAMTWPSTANGGGPAYFSGPVDGLFVVYITCGLLAFFFLRTVPVAGRASGGTEGGRAAGQGSLASLTLFAIALLFFGHGSLGIFLVRVGRELGLDGETIGYVFMAGALVGIVAPLIAGFVGPRMRPLVPLLSIVTLLLAACYAVAATRSGTVFMVAVPVFGALPTAFMPILLGVIARFDPTGRMAGSHPAFVLIGGAVAPFAGGYVRDMGDSFLWNGYFACGCIAVAFLLMLPLIRSDGSVSTRRSELLQP